LFFGSRFIHGERPAFERLVVELPDRFLCLRRIGEFNECKPSFSSCFPIERNGDIREVANGREVLPDFIFRSIVGKVPHKKTD
jgi:hypothetical protein